MSSDKQRDLTPVLPKKERKTFFILLALIILLAANLALVISGDSVFPAQENPFIGSNGEIISDGKLFIILGSVAGFSLILSIIGVYKKNYCMLASIGCMMIIAAHLSFIFGENTYQRLLIGTITMLGALALIIPAINERICQLGPKKTAPRRLGFAYAFFPLTYFSAEALLNNMENYSSIDSILVAKLLCAGLSLLTLLVWIFSMRKNIWSNTRTEEKTSENSCKSIICTIASLLSHMVILIVLWQSLICAEIYTKNLSLFIIILCFGAFFASYWSKNIQISRRLHRIGFIFISTSIILLSGFFTALTLPEDMMAILLLINAAFIPLCLANYRRALINSSFPQNKGWIQLLLVLNFPASSIACALILTFHVLSTVS